MMKFLILLSAVIYSCSACTAPFSPNPSDCTSYFQCVGGRNIPGKCPAGLEWNAQASVCDWPASAGCSKTGPGPVVTPPPKPVDPSVTSKPTTGGMITQAEFNCAAATKQGNPDASYYNGFIKSLPQASITDKNEAAKFLAHAAWETVGFQFTKEQYCIANLAACASAYPNTKGKPGKVYYGRGMLQLTWDYNYAGASQALYGDDRLIQNPDVVENDPAVGWATAAWFWKENVHRVASSFGPTLKAINGALECDGGSHGQNRILRFNHYKQVLQCLKIAAPADSDGWCSAWS